MPHELKAVVISDPLGIELVRLCALRSMLNIEVNTPLRHSRANVAELARRATGSTEKNKAKLILLLNDLIAQKEKARRVFFEMVEDQVC
jgi:alpha-galactosidase/6-phospho-beta-glucosidase family protein